MDRGSSPPRKKQKTEDNSLYDKLEEVLNNYIKKLNDDKEKVSFEASELVTAYDFDKAKQILEEHGFIIIKNAISTDSIKEAKKNLGECICDLWSESLKEKKEIQKQLKSGNIQCFQQFRNSKNGQGNASFGYYYKQYLKDEDYPKYKIGKDEIKFDHNPVHAKVNLELLCHPDNRHSLAILLGITHLQGIISWDSVKFATNPRPKPKTMTKQQLTPMHIDHYSNEISRYQAIDNVDSGNIKLFFIPGSNRIEFRDLLCKIANQKIFDCYGYKQVGFNEKLKELLCKFAIAPPPMARIIWKSGTVHFEGNSNLASKFRDNSPFAGCYSCLNLNDVPNCQRFRFVIGNHLPTQLEQSDLMKLAIIAERGLCPAIYGSVNKGTCVDKNIVNRKTTQYKIPRTITTDELQYLRDKLLEIPATEEKLVEALQEEIPSKLKQLLYGIQLPVSEELGFSKEDTLILNK